MGRYALQVRAVFAVAVTTAALVAPAVSAAPGDPEVTVWYGPAQSFSATGIPQPWVNVVGNVADPDGIIDLTYSLNGGPQKSLRPRYATSSGLAIGPDGRRLIAPGDFNVELDKALLAAGANQLVITATDATQAVTQTNVTVNFAGDTYWPETYDVVWSNVSDVQSAVQVVDGQWTITSNGLRPTVMGYDRVVALGDMNWDDYEITVPFTLHAIDPNGFSPLSGSPGFGITFRWNGHVPGPVYPDAQPRYYWWPSGGGMWYDAGFNGPLSIGTWAGNLYEVDNSGFVLPYGVPYLFKLRVETVPGVGSLYSFRIWEQGQPEPAAWMLSGVESAVDVPYGSCILVAHHVDVTIGDIHVEAVPDPNPPILSDIRVVPTDTSATITWKTNEPATSSVAHGLSAAYEDGPVANGALVRSHTVVLPDLTTGATYHFQVTSLDVDSNGASSIDLTFVAETDTVPPTFIDVQVAETDRTATITWTTDELATSVIEYWSDGIDTNAVADAALVIDHGLQLTGLEPATLYHFRVGGEDLSANFASTNGPSFTTLASTLESDSFDSCTLDPRWLFINPLGDASYALTGNQAAIVIPATGQTHDAWTDGNFLPRLSQSVANADIALEVKFDSMLTASFQSQGVLAEEDGPGTRVIRAEFHHFAGATKLFVASIFGQSVQQHAFFPLTLSAPMYLRMSRSGDSWTVAYRFESTNWTTAAVFTTPMTLARVSVYGGNSDTVPHTALIDYFFDQAAPIVPEDDCNDNGIADEFDIAAGTSTDFNGNGVPDACECAADCNTNGVVDFLDIAGGTSGDCDANGVPDECEPDCNTNGLPDACESFADCNSSGAPDECELAGNDCNTNGVPDECDADCNTNGLPDACEVFADCNSNGVPDECELAGNDCNTNGVPDECDADCNTNGLPDDCESLADCNTNGLPDFCDIAAGTSADCNGNLVPDECEPQGDCNTNGVQDICDIAAGTSTDCDADNVPDSCILAGNDCNGNGQLDVCDIAGAASPDVNGDGVPDECQVQNLTRATAHPTIAAAFTAAFNGDQLLAPAAQFAAEPTIDFANKAVTLTSAAALEQPAGGVLTMTDGAALAAAAGADMVLNGLATVEFLDRVDLFAERFILAPTGTLRVKASGGASVHAPAEGRLTGATFVEPQATLAFTGPLENTATLTLQGGVLAASGIVNAATNGLLTGYGDISANVTNDGQTIVIADTQIVGDYVNNGATTIQNGTLTIVGTLTNSGTILGDTAGAKQLQGLPKSAGTGVFVVGDIATAADAALLLPTPDLRLKLGGDFDVAIDSNGLFDLAAATLQCVGLAGTTQDFEVMSTDLGAVFAGLNRNLPGHYPLGTLRLGPMPTTVSLRDLHDNDAGGQGAPEAIYVHDLTLDAGTTLLTNGLHVYYVTLAGAGNADNPANLIPLLPPAGDCDGDGDVDAADFAGFAECLAGPLQTPPVTATAGCVCLDTFDFDADGDVDLPDFAAFQRAFAP